MCGIAGIAVRSGSPPAPELERRILDVLRHRGPDSEGISRFSTSNAAHLSLLHTRLKILDLSSNGNQPMADPERDNTIIYNGELYNFKELRSLLIKDGFHFTSRSDTEVVLKAYAKWGVDCLSKFEGMFAFAIFDKNKGIVLLARDRLGIKPLYFYKDSNHFLFASEIKAILVHPAVHRTINPVAINEYLMYRTLSGDRTLFSGINSLPAAHCAFYTLPGELTVRRYWRPADSLPERPTTFTEAVNRLDELLEASVKAQLVSDVPVGIQLSGGVDSSLLTAYASKNAVTETFSIDFCENRFSEGAYIKRMVEKYNTIHHHFFMKNNEFVQYIKSLIWHMDEPLYHPHQIPLFLLCKHAKEKITVLLAGEGADELFGGYFWYRKIGATRTIRTLIPQKISPLFSLIAGRFGSSAARFFEMALTGDWKHIIQNLHAFIPYPMLQSILSPEMLCSYEEISANRSEQSFPFQGEHALNTALAFDQETYMEALLRRQDKMSMAAGIEVRVPFLDSRILSFSRVLPEEWKVQGSMGKRIVKKLAEKYVPYDNIYRKKIGFFVPVGIWFRGNDGIGELLSVCTDNRAQKRGLFSNRTINQILLHHKKGVADYGESILWPCMNIELWCRTFFDASPDHDPARSFFL